MQERIRKLGATTLAILWIASCDSKDEGLAESSSSGGVAESSPSEGGESPPPECVDVELFESEACLAAVMAACRANSSREDCWGADPTVLDAENGRIVHCTWTDVIEVLDVVSCELGAPYGRCEAALAAGLNGSVHDACVDGVFTEPGHLAMLESLELVDITPSPDGTLYTEPIGPWSLIGGDGASMVASCSTGASPAGPDWCTCGPAACAAAAE